MKRITISYTEKEEVWINEYPAMSKFLGLDQNDAIEISRSTVEREMGVSI